MKEKVVIITTNDYHILFKQSDNWRRVDCANAEKIIKGLYPEGTENSVRDCFKWYDNISAKSFWNDWKKDDNLKILKRELKNVNIFVMPCIPKAQIFGTREGILKMSLEQRQNYIAAIIDDVMIEENKKPEEKEINLKDIYVVAHDLDILNNHDNRTMKQDDLIENSDLKNKIALGIKISQIYGFQHESFYKMYRMLSTLKEDTVPDSFMISIIEIIEESITLRTRLF